MRNILKKNNLVLLAGCSLLCACSTADRIAQIGRAPDMAPITNPTTQANYQPVSLPMPSQKKAARQKNSLWQSDRVTFFKDQRAGQVGDILTVLIDIKDQASIDNETERTRTSSEGAGLNSLLGYEQSLNRVLPEAVDNSSLSDFNSDSAHKGKGTITRDDTIKLRLAALIMQTLPNGNLVIHGKQEVLVNFEKRVLQVDGVVRPEDISVQNTINYDQIAEARIVYGGQGQLTDVQQPRYGQQLYDIIFPF